ncbi:alpha/beta fold hydrolase [Streptomyces sp. NPDC087903]|uniref:alpha/beta fold hydrolase n=1 Tax=Streptomyces sp. NPDC087903 TaxID=3365819 RepID=UPI00380BC2F3
MRAARRRNRLGACRTRRRGAGHEHHHDHLGRTHDRARARGVRRVVVQELYHAQFAADSPEHEAAVMAVTQRPIAESALGEPSGEPAWKTIPSWFLIGGKDKNIPAASQRFMAERAGSLRTVELPDGSHTVGIPEAAADVDLVREAAAHE